MREDPYRIADVFVPWDWEEERYGYGLGEDETEWPDRDEPARILAVAKSREARNRVRRYLAMNGAAVWARVERSLAEAHGSRDAYPAGSIVAAVTAAELVIRFLLLRPLIAGLVFNTKLAMTLVREGQSPRTERDRRLLPVTCRAWQLDLEALTLPNGQLLWESLRSVIEVRNKHVHRAEPVLREQAAGAIDCAEGLIDQAVRPLSTRFGLEWPPGGWNHGGRTHDPVEASFDYMGS